MALSKFGLHIHHKKDRDVKLLSCFCTKFVALGCMLLVFLLASCKDELPTKIPEIGDGGFLSEQPCGPPCFWNIGPGITTKDQAIEILKSRGIYQGCEFFDNTAESGIRGIMCSHIVTINLQDTVDIVSGVGFGPSQVIRVEEVIRKYGEPDAVLVTARGLPETEYYTSMILYYDEFKANLVLAENKGGVYELTSTSHVENIGYSDKISYDRIRRYFQKWNGYGVYEQYNP